MTNITELTENIRPSVVRVIVEYEGGPHSLGAGFYCEENRILTCNHVMMGPQDVTQTVQSLQQQHPGRNTDSLLLEWFTNRRSKIKVELHDGSIIEGADLKINYKYDIAAFTIDVSGPPIERSNDIPSLGEQVCFWGFPTVAFTNPEKNPFAVNTGIISAKANTKVCGHEKRNFLQINAINLEGNSGGPVVSLSDGKLIGIVNGNMIRGNQNVAHMVVQNGQPILQKGSIMIPLGIAYATEIKTLLDHCDFIN